jgi:hypothetical protein
MITFEAINHGERRTAVRVPAGRIAKRQHITGMETHHGIQGVIIALGRMNRFAGPDLLRRFAEIHQEAGYIVFLHRGLGGKQGRTGYAARWPWLIAFIFGLLHGFGFAGALAEISLPQQAITLALIFFNVGVELG